MGWAARAKERRGNPKPADLKVRYIRADAHEKQSVLGRAMCVVFGDRQYVMDAKGTLRRVQPTAKTFSMRTLQD